MVNYVVLDIATAPLEEAADYLEEPSPPANYKDPAKIEVYIAEAKAKALEKAALDPDLCRITCVGGYHNMGQCDPWQWGPFICRDEAGERAVIGKVADLLSPANAVAVTYNGRSFDLPVLQRRALYLGVPFPKLDLSRWKSPHLDLCELLADGEMQRKRSLDFYVKRLDWADLDPKPMEAAEEAQVFEHNDWQRLEASVRRDVTAIHRLACWLGVLPKRAAQGGVR